MNCSDVHLHLGAEPNATSPELDAHVRECAACAQFQLEMLRLEEKIRRALLVDVQALAQPRPVASYSRARRWAQAASVVIAVAAALALWSALPGRSLAADVVSHVVSEPLDQRVGSPVDEATIRDVMERSGLHLSPINPSIVFMRTCLLRGRFVPHFVVRTERGMATVLVLPDEHVNAPEHFNGSGYKGVIIPDTQKGSVVVMSRADVDMERYAAEIRDAVRPLATTPSR